MSRNISSRRAVAGVCKPPAQPLSLLTYNLLAPCYFQLKTDAYGKKVKVEAQLRTAWERRFAQQLAFLRESEADVLCLQEVWFKPDVFAKLREALGAEYALHCARRTQGKDDGVALLVKRSRWEVVEARGVEFAGAGNRVMMMACLESTAPAARGCATPMAVVATTHLTFPSTPADDPVRLSQAETASSELLAFAREMEQRAGRSAIVSALSTAAIKRFGAPVPSASSASASASAAGAGAGAGAGLSSGSGFGGFSAASAHGLASLAALGGPPGGSSGGDAAFRAFGGGGGPLAALLAAAPAGLSAPASAASVAASAVSAALAAGGTGSSFAGSSLLASSSRAGAGAGSGRDVRARAGMAQDSGDDDDDDDDDESSGSSSDSGDVTSSDDDDAGAGAGGGAGGDSLEVEIDAAAAGVGASSSSPSAAAAGPRMPVFLAGDFNHADDDALRFLRRAGWCDVFCAARLAAGAAAAAGGSPASSTPASGASEATASASASAWASACGPPFASHVTHAGQNVGVDFIFAFAPEAAARMAACLPPVPVRAEAAAARDSDDEVSALPSAKGKGGKGKQQQGSGSGKGKGKGGKAAAAVAVKPPPPIDPCIGLVTSPDDAAAASQPVLTIPLQLSESVAVASAALLPSTEPPNRVMPRPVPQKVHAPWMHKGGHEAGALAALCVTPREAAPLTHSPAGDTTPRHHLAASASSAGGSAATAAAAAALKDMDVDVDDDEEGLGLGLAHGGSSAGAAGTGAGAGAVPAVPAVPRAAGLLGLLAGGGGGGSRADSDARSGSALSPSVGGAGAADAAAGSGTTASLSAGSSGSAAGDAAIAHDAAAAEAALAVAAPVPPTFHPVRPAAALTFRDWCSLSDHRPVLASFCLAPPPA